MFDSGSWSNGHITFLPYEQSQLGLTINIFLTLYQKAKSANTVSISCALHYISAIIGDKPQLCITFLCSLWQHQSGRLYYLLFYMLCWLFFLVYPLSKNCCLRSLAGFSKCSSVDKICLILRYCPVGIAWIVCMGCHEIVCRKDFTDVSFL